MPLHSAPLKLVLEQFTIGLLSLGLYICMTIIFFVLRQNTALDINIFRNTTLRINRSGRLRLYYVTVLRSGKE